MAWELQSHTHSRVPPSVWQAAVEHSPSRAHQWWWLAQRWADQRWDESTGVAAYAALRSRALAYLRQGSIQFICIEIATHAIEHASATTNGGHEVYLDGWTSIPWCSDEQHEAWWA